MTHPESQDLLLDLAYGELPPARAAELLAHLAGCAECQREKAAIEQARRMAAPLRELEEPPAGFDDRILAAARAQAQLEHEGNIGQVIEVEGSVRPAGLEPAQVDAHAKVARRKEQRRPRWMVRVALGGSVAAAAALALVMSTSLQQRQKVEAARASVDKAYEIRIQPAPVALLPSGAVQKARKEAAAAAESPTKPQETEPSVPRGSEPRRAKKAATPEDAAGAGALGGLRGGSGGDALDSVVAEERVPPAVATPPAVAQPPAAAPPRAVATSPAIAPPPAVATSPAAAPPPAAAASTTAQRAAREDSPLPEVRARVTASNGAAQVAQNRQQIAATTATPPVAPVAKGSRSAAEVEEQAQEARHGGSYPLAAALYREAASLRRAEAPQGTEAAWDLAHAVECLAAAGRFDEARGVRDELAKLSSTAPGAFAAAGRALREVDAPAQRDARPPAKSKSESSVPVDF